MATGSVVEDFDVLEYGAVGFVGSLELMTVDQFDLEGVPENFGDGMVVVAAGAAPHAGDDAKRGERGTVIVAGILAAAMGLFAPHAGRLPLLQTRSICKGKPCVRNARNQRRYCNHL